MDTFNANGNTSVAYNNFLEAPKIPYMIFEKLVSSTSDSAENLFKIIKYTSVDALKEPKLTKEEKMKLLWTPEKVGETTSQQNLFNIFLKPLVSSSLDDVSQQIQLRIHNAITKPTSNVEAVIGYQFDMITPEVADMIYIEGNTILVSRIALMEAYILDVLNGADLSVGSSYFQFYNRELNSIAKSTLSINNGKSLYGRSMVLCLNYINPKSGGGCV